MKGTRITERVFTEVARSACVATAWVEGWEEDKESMKFRDPDGKVVPTAQYRREFRRQLAMRGIFVGKTIPSKPCTS